MPKSIFDVLPIVRERLLTLGSDRDERAAQERQEDLERSDG